MEFSQKTAIGSIYTTRSGSAAVDPNKLPRSIVWIIVATCLAPYLLMIAGVDLGSRPPSFDPAAMTDLSSKQVVDLAFHGLSGAFTHTLLEWSAFCAAIFTVWLAFSHYYLTKDVATLVIAIALFFSGAMDAFHTIAADRLMAAVSDPTNLVPFTWAICRLFNALIMVLGVGLFLIRGVERYKITLRAIVAMSFSCAVIAYGIIHYCAVSEILPQTQFPDAFITRPYDFVPLLIYLFAGLFLYPRFFKKTPSLFAHALIISAFVEIAVELHMAFGSSRLFDSHFNAAHFLKIIAYLVPLTGLTLDYIYTYREKQKTERELKQTVDRLSREISVRERGEKDLKINNRKLEQSNERLNQFAFVASHDLQEPLRKIETFSGFLTSELANDLSEEHQDYFSRMKNAVERMRNLITVLLEYSRVTNNKTPLKPVNLSTVIHAVIDDFANTLKKTNAEIEVSDDLPTIMADEAQIQQLFQNLISNGLKFKNPGIEPRMKIFQTGYNPADNTVTIAVEDSGIGIDKKYHEKIFGIFQRLHGRDEYEGTGIGLAICSQVVGNCGGTINLESESGKGTRFLVTFPTGE